MGLKQPQHETGHSFIRCQGQEWVELCLHSSICLHAVLLNEAQWHPVPYLGVPRDPAPIHSRQHVGILEGHFSYVIFF